MDRKSALVLSLIAAATQTISHIAFATESTIDLKDQAEALVKKYSMSLQTALKGALEISGPVGAISFCHDQAPPIAAGISRDGWTVGRTSQKARNASSTPNDYELKVMEEFSARIAKGEAVIDMTKAEIVEEAGGSVFHLVKAIPTGEVCLTCHGANIKPEVKAKLDELYPGDKATGFNLGDMRGVFTLTKRL